MRVVPEPSPPSPVVPDWSRIDRDVLCPLCEYNLRGLSEPRCPECGHQFVWIDLLDRSRWEHPWLFEHQRKRRIRSFFRTFFTSILPWRFWRSVQPTHKPRPGWMFLYWLVFASLAGLVMAAPLAVPLIEALIFDLPWMWTVQNALELSRAHRRALVALGLMYVCWPGVTILVLMIFRQTMRQARIVPNHVVRCAVYSSDVLILMAVPILTLLRVTRSFGYSGRFSGWSLVGPLASPPVLITLMLSLVLLTWRLATAYRMYLRFPHAIATCILSQVVVGLAMFTAYMIWVTSRW